MNISYNQINDLMLDFGNKTFDGKLWLLLVEKATVGTDGKLTFTLRNGMEIKVKIYSFKWLWLRCDFSRSQPLLFVFKALTIALKYDRI